MSTEVNEKKLHMKYAQKKIVVVRYCIFFTDPDCQGFFTFQDYKDIYI